MQDGSGSAVKGLHDVYTQQLVFVTDLHTVMAIKSVHSQEYQGSCCDVKIVVLADSAPS